MADQQGWKIGGVESQTAPPPGPVVLKGGWKVGGAAPAQPAPLPGEAIPGMELLGGTPPGPPKPPAITPKPLDDGAFLAKFGFDPAEAPAGMGTHPLAALGDLPIQGVEQVLAGGWKIGRSGAFSHSEPDPYADQAAQPLVNLPQATEGATDVVLGGMKAATPLLPAAAVFAPGATAATLALGTAAGVGTEKGLEALGVRKEYAGFAGAIASVLAGGKPGLKALSKLHESMGSPEIKLGGKFETPKEFGAMTDEELIAHANKIEADSPKNYDWQKQEIVQEAGRRQAAKGMPAGDPAAPSNVPAKTDLGGGWTVQVPGEGSAIEGGPVSAVAPRPKRTVPAKVEPVVPPVVPPVVAPVIDSWRARSEPEKPAEAAPAPMAGPIPEVPPAPPAPARPVSTGPLPAREPTIEKGGWNIGPALETPAVTTGTPPAPAAEQLTEPSAAPERTINREESEHGQPAAAVDAGTARALDSGATGEGGALHGSPAAGAGRASGEDTDILIPGEERAIRARYEVRELADVQPSHHGQTFSGNPAYAHQNERDYSKAENQQRVIENSSEERFNPRYHITDNPDATNGPVLIDENGNAIGGNSRAMILQRVYGRDGQSAAGYRALLEKKAAQFGIDPGAIRGMKQPVLVRVASNADLESLPGGHKWAIRKTNVSGTAQLSASERAAADAGQLSPELIEHVAGAIEKAGPDATLNDALTGKSGTAVVNRLIAEGFFSEQERPSLMDGRTGALTQLAKDRISKAMLGQFFRDSDQIARTPAAIRAKLERVAAPLAKIQGNPEWDLTPRVREAVDLIEYANAHGIKNLGDVLAQQSMFGETPQWSADAVKLAEWLRDRKPNDLVGAVRKYVNDREPTMFGETTPADSFETHFHERAPEGPHTPSDRSGERGSFSRKPLPPEEHGPDFKKKDHFAKSATDFFKPVETRIRQEGPAGKELARKLIRAQDIGEVSAGKRVVKLRDAGLQDLSRTDRQNLVDSLQGFASPANAAVQKVLDAVRMITDELAGEASAAKVKVKVKATLRPGDPIPAGARLTPSQILKRAAGEKVAITYRRPFRGRQNFYPHVIPSADTLQSGDVRKDVIDNMVRNGVQPDSKTAATMIDEYRQFIDEGGRAKTLEAFLVSSGQARDSAEARMLMDRFRKRAIKRQGSLEYSRTADWPFYDPDPGRTLPQFVAASSMRLAQVREFGQDNEQVNRLVKIIDDTGGNAVFVRAAVDRALGMVNDADSAEARISRAVRMLNGFKLGLSFIPNATQGALNSFLKSDLPSTLAGARGLMTAEGRRFAMQTGASLDGVINEMLRAVGADQGPLGKFLKVTGFGATEQANRVWAANAGAAYAKRMLAKLQKDPTNTRARAVLEELGLKPAVLLKLGKLDGDALLIAAKKFSDMTQFRGGVKDLPMFASSPMGKVIFQFKSFVYGQTRLVHDELIGELQAGRFGRGFRTLLILATVFPIAGEVISDVRSWVKGGKRESQGIKRYLEDVAQAGGLGVAYDMLTSGAYGKGVNFLAGPTLSDIGDIANAIGQGKDVDAKMRNLGKFAFRHIPFMGPVLYDRVFPKKEATSAEEKKMRSEQRRLMK